MVSESGQAIADRGRLVRIDPGGEDHRVGAQAGREDFDQLVRALVLAEHRLGEAGAQGAVMVQAGGGEHLHLQAAQPVDGLGDLHAAVTHLPEQSGQGLFIHGATLSKISGQSTTRPSERKQFTAAAPFVRVAHRAQTL